MHAMSSANDVIYTFEMKAPELRLMTNHDPHNLTALLTSNGCILYNEPFYDLKMDSKVRGKVRGWIHFCTCLFVNKILITEQ